MFHCYHLKDDSSDLSRSSLSDRGPGTLMSRIRTRSNYSPVLTMGLPHALDLVFGRRTRPTEKVRHLFRSQSMDAIASNDYEMVTLSIKEPSKQTRSYHRDSLLSAFALRTMSIDVPFLYHPNVDADEGDDRNMLVSYSYRNKVISIAMPSTNVSGHRAMRSLSTGDVSLQTDVHMSQNELADLSMAKNIISEPMVNIELSQLVDGIRPVEGSVGESDGTLVTYGGLVESQIVTIEALNNTTPPSPT